MTDLRALCARMADELDHYRQLLMDDRRETHALATEARAALAQPEPPADGEVAELVVWLRYNADYALQKAATATFKRFHRAADLLERLAQSEPQGPTDEEILALSQEHGVSYTRLNGGVIYPRPEGYDMRGDVLSFARAVLARWGRPAIEPVPKREDVHYAWELHDAEGEWQAGGSANSLEDVQREGNRYLQTYLQDGPHKLIIERHCVTTIEPVPGVEVE